MRLPTKPCARPPATPTLPMVLADSGGGDHFLAGFSPDDFQQLITLAGEKISHTCPRNVTFGDLVNVRMRC